MSLSNLTVLKTAVAEWHASKGTNFAAWLDLAHDDIQMKSLGEGAPTLGFANARQGKAAFADYLAGHQRVIDLQSFEISEYVEQDDRVVGFGKVSLAGRQTGRSCTTEVAIYAKFLDGKIIELMEFFDTKRLAE
ncbi:MAG: nuclear transport factor 2 family protein, partial [Pseudomonadota bacterium]